MYSTSIVTEFDECREIWQRLMPREFITDLWEVRACFHQHFKRTPHFIVAKNGSQIHGLLPLSWIEESRSYGFFPGETWQGKTWLEQNRIHALGPGGLEALLSHCPSPHHVRYLSLHANLPCSEAVVDEIGYLFLPPQYDYDMENYFREFSHKSIKQILREVAAIENLGVTYRHGEIADFDLMVKMNFSRFGTASYFHDPRFRESFRTLAHFLHEKGWLRFTTVLINGDPAAVDMGCIYRDVYTVMAGGTNSNYLGVAKLINLHHMKWACQNRLKQVDFLCGDFKWKRLFHLTPRPLFLLSNLTQEIVEPLNMSISARASNV